MVAVALALGAGPLAAQSPFKVTPALSGELTWTNNVDLRSSDERQSDFVFHLTPGLRVDYQAARAQLSGSISAPILLYARTGEHNNRVLPVADLTGNVEVVKDFFFVDASANVAQSYFNPFGPRPANPSTATENEYTSATYRVAPYIQGVIGSNIRYRLRDDNIWTQLDDSPVGADQLYTNSLTGSIDRDPTPIGWGADISRVEYDFPDQPKTHLIEYGRLRLVHRPDPVWQFFVSGGYEHNRFSLTESDGPIYGVGVSWRPNERSALDAAWEHRFFGDSYSFSFDHRGPRTAFSARASRNITSYPEQLGELPSGSFVPGILNQILASRIPDPLERARFIVNYIRDRGLQIFLSEPLSLYAQQIYLQESVSATFGILGVRNSIFFSVHRTRTEPITGAGIELPPAVSAVHNNTQLGVGAAWTYQLTPSATLTLSADASRTEANAPFTAQTDQRTVRIGVTRPISPKTSAFAGARYQSLDSNAQENYRETAVFVGASHEFR